MLTLENLESLLIAQSELLFSELTKVLKILVILDIVFVCEIFGKFVGLSVGYSLKHFFIPLISMILLGMIFLVKLSFQSLALLTEIIYEQISQLA